MNNPCIPFGLLLLVVSAFDLTSLCPVAARPHDHLKQPAEWFHAPAARERLANLLSHQDKDGCWPKNLDTTAKAYAGKRDALRGTFDNSATVHELRLLARGFRVTKDERYREAFLEGVSCILKAQYTNGGWPQSPRASGYGQHITFNDDTLIGLMTLLREIYDEKDYHFVPGETRQQAREAFDRGVQCILDCQIRVDGRLTAWCAQHDRKTLEPCGARSYEHPSISGGESAGILCLLMSLDEPTDEIRRSVRAGVAWYGQSTITGLRAERKDGNRTIVPDPAAPPLWARFYEIDTNRPIFSGRDGVIKYALSEIEAERRNGYAWYVSSGKRVEVAWSRWKWK
jgi:PelA/Pel-15E family pectate lyase